LNIYKIKKNGGNYKYSNKDEIRIHTRAKPIGLDSPTPLPLGHLVIFDNGDSLIFLELRRMEAIKSTPTRMRFKLGLDSPTP
jgi:hypothetical protein